MTLQDLMFALTFVSALKPYFTTFFLIPYFQPTIFLLVTSTLLLDDRFGSKTRMIAILVNLHEVFSLIIFFV